MRGKLTDVCNDASGMRNERPKFLAMNFMKSFVRSMHEKNLLHAGYKKTFEKVWCHVVHVSVTVYVLLVLSCRVCIMVFQEVW